MAAAGLRRGLKWFVKHVYAPFLDWSLDNRLGGARRRASILLLAGGHRPQRHHAVQALSRRSMPTACSPRSCFPTARRRASPRRRRSARGSGHRRRRSSCRRADAPIVTFVHRSVGQVRRQGEARRPSRMSGSHLGAVGVELVEGESTATSRASSSSANGGGPPVSCPAPSRSCSPRENIGPGGKTIEFKLLAQAEPDSVRQLEAAVERCKEWLARVSRRDRHRRRLAARQVGIPDEGQAEGRGAGRLAGRPRLHDPGELLRRGGDAAAARAARGEADGRLSARRAADVRHARRDPRDGARRREAADRRTRRRRPRPAAIPRSTGSARSGRSPSRPTSTPRRASLTRRRSRPTWSSG